LDEPPILLNAILALQGPNYCLAKMLQQWRCIVSRAQGIVVSAPHAPPTRTRCVTHNAVAATALLDQAYVCPLVAFDATVTSSLMTSILLAHLQDPPILLVSPSSNSNHDPAPSGHRLLELFWDGAVHGGIWRCPVTMASIGAPTYLLGRLVPRRYPAASLAATAVADEPEQHDGGVDCTAVCPPV
jgi:hypothetical protein